MPKFEIQRTFFFQARDILYIIGDITEGRIKIGMKFKFRDKEFIINHIDFVDGKENDVPYSKVALGITPNDRSYFDRVLSEAYSINIDILST